MNAPSPSLPTDILIADDTPTNPAGLLRGGGCMALPAPGICLDVAESTGGTRFEVSGTGIGIPTECPGKIFERFDRVHDTQPEKRASTGPGFTFCPLAVEAHGGTINLQREAGTGSVFRFTLPRQEEPARTHRSTGFAESEPLDSRPGMKR